MSTVYLIRHATPDWSRTDLRYDIPPGPPLTAQGENEAAQLGVFLRDAGVGQVYTSPLVRAQRTAAIAGEIAGAEVVERIEIAEWQREENDEAVLTRLLPFWAASTLESQAHGPVALVSHGGPIRLLLAHLGLDRLEMDFYRKQFDRDNPLPPAGAWRISRPHVEAAWQVELVFTPQPFRRYEPQTVLV